MISVFTQRDFRSTLVQDKVRMESDNVESESREKILKQAGKLIPTVAIQPTVRQPGRLGRMAHSDPDHSLWMTRLPAEVRNLPLSRLAIPGSHDSLTYNLTK